MGEGCKWCAEWSLKLGAREAARFFTITNCLSSHHSGFDQYSAVVKNDKYEVEWGAIKAWISKHVLLADRTENQALIDRSIKVDAISRQALAGRAGRYRRPSRRNKCMWARQDDGWNSGWYALCIAILGCGLVDTRRFDHVIFHFVLLPLPSSCCDLYLVLPRGSVPAPVGCLQDHNLKTVAYMKLLKDSKSF